MQSLRSPRANCSSLAHIYGDIKCIAMGFRTLSISCVKRSANFAAHSLAKYARQIVEELVWLEAPRTPPPPNPPNAYSRCPVYVEIIGLWMNEMGLCPKNKVGLVRETKFYSLLSLGKTIIILFKYCDDVENCESFKGFGFKSILKNFIWYKISNCKVVKFLINMNYKGRRIIDNGGMKSLMRGINKLKINKKVWQLNINKKTKPCIREKIVTLST